MVHSSIQSYWERMSSSENFDLSSNIFAKESELKITPKSNVLILTRRKFIAIFVPIFLLLGVGLVLSIYNNLHVHDDNAPISK